jgi:hypothetical protein
MELVHVRPHRSHTKFGMPEYVHGYTRDQPMHYRKRRVGVRKTRQIVVVAAPIRRRRVVRRRI